MGSEKVWIVKNKKKGKRKNVTFSLDSICRMRDRSEPKCAHRRRGITLPSPLKPEGKRGDAPRRQKCVSRKLLFASF